MTRSERRLFWPHLYDEQGKCTFICPVPTRYEPPNANYPGSRIRCCDCRAHPRCGYRCNVVTYYVLEVRPTYFAWWEREEARP